ncbi:pyridoxal-phosphate dependent enzyme [Limibacter armeniacum]|uniref:pyridoxal-phosphate dependent enzyme n=1 Tax=Limibacter armeniacum TaxID=466084 RepID=UPI002FE5396D
MDKSKNTYPDLLSMIGNTPLVKANHLDTGVCELYLKMESMNPGGSIKDRIGLSMIQDAEAKGLIKPGDTLIEATAGNTGLGLALVAALKGYKMMLVIPDKMSQEKISHLTAMGVEIIMTRSDVGKGHPEYYQDLAAKIAEERPNTFYINQFQNQANPLAHETSTGPEIFDQTDGEVDAVVCGVGSGGTISGLAHYFQKVKPDVEMVLADPEGSILADYIHKGSYGEAGSWFVEGIGEDFIPDIADLSNVKKAYTVSDKDSLLTARELLLKEGILAGSSSGTIVTAALRYCREQTTPKKVVAFVCDSGSKYFSKMFNDHWMEDQGFIERETYHDLRDVVSRFYTKREVVTAKPSDTLQAAYSKMKMYDVSQLPVIEDGKIVGILDEHDLLIAVHKNSHAFQQEVKSAMTSNLTLIHPKDSMDKLTEILEQGYVAILTEGDNFIGLITKIDLLNYLKRKNNK